MTAAARHRRWDVIGLGANSVDYVYRLPAPPAINGPNAKMRIARHLVSCGGQTVTTLATVASFGLRGKYVGVTGNDEAGSRMRRELQSLGLDTDHVITRDAPNPFAVILVDDGSGERIVLWERASSIAMQRDEIPVDLLSSTRVLHVDDTDQPAAIEAARVASAAGAVVTSDVDRLTDLTEELIAAVTIPIFAEQVPVALTGESDPERALRKLRRSRDPEGMLCVTLGPEGAMLLMGDRMFYQHAPVVHAVDTTGAGDIFRGAFIYAMLRGDGPADILRFANAAASSSCTREGAIASVPSLDDVDASLGAGQSRDAT